MTPEFTIPKLWVQNCGCFILYPIGSPLIEPSFSDEFGKERKMDYCWNESSLFDSGLLLHKNRLNLNVIKRFLEYNSSLSCSSLKTIIHSFWKLSWIEDQHEMLVHQPYFVFREFGVFALLRFAYAKGTSHWESTEEALCWRDWNIGTCVKDGIDGG